MPILANAKVGTELQECSIISKKNPPKGGFFILVTEMFYITLRFKISISFIAMCLYM